MWLSCIEWSVQIKMSVQRKNCFWDRLVGSNQNCRSRQNSCLDLLVGSNEVWKYSGPQCDYLASSGRFKYKWVFNAKIIFGIGWSVQIKIVVQSKTRVWICWSVRMKNENIVVPNVIILHRVVGSNQNECSTQKLFLGSDGRFKSKLSFKAKLVFGSVGRCEWRMKI